MASGISIPETPEKDQESEASTSEAQSDPSSDAAKTPMEDQESEASTSKALDEPSSDAAETPEKDQESEASTTQTPGDPSSDAEREDITDKKEKETTAPEHKEDHGSKDPSQSMAEKMTALRGLISSKQMFWNKANVRIFSRSSESEYGWLVELLRSDLFGYQVWPHSITNNGYRQFAEAVSECSFGILYHSKNRGRVNVTDVTDSLYDEELAHLHDKLGKQRVIVVIDDLEDSRDQEKARILNNQPSIRELAQELFLISLEEKTSDYQPNLKSEQSWPKVEFAKLPGIEPVIQAGNIFMNWVVTQVQKSLNSKSESQESPPPAPLSLEPSSQGSLESNTHSEED